MGQKVQTEVEEEGWSKEGAKRKKGRVKNRSGEEDDRNGYSPCRFETLTISKADGIANTRSRNPLQIIISAEGVEQLIVALAIPTRIKAYRSCDTLKVQGA